MVEDIALGKTYFYILRNYDRPHDLVQVKVFELSTGLGGGVEAFAKIQRSVDKRFAFFGDKTVTLEEHEHLYEDEYAARAAHSRMLEHQRVELLWAINRVVQVASAEVLVIKAEVRALREYIESREQQE